MSRLINTDVEELAAINVTPIIDVALVLVIILMMTAPMMAMPPFDLDLPTAHSLGVDNDRNVNVTLAPDGRVAIDDKVMPMEDFRSELSARFADQTVAERLLVVRADAAVPYTAVQQVLQSARAAGAGRIAIAVRPPQRKS